jgi:apolipoprotein N-acyltransferase
MKYQTGTLMLRLAAGAAGSALLFFYGFRYNLSLGPWFALPLLLFSFRGLKPWPLYIPFVALTALFRWLSLHGGWSMDTGMEIAFSFLMNLPIYAALAADRIIGTSLRPPVRSLVFPAVFTVSDWLLVFTPLGGICSLAYTQTAFPAVCQLGSITGMPGIAFLVAWFAPVMVETISAVGRFRSQITASAITPLLVYAPILAAVLIFGSVKPVVTEPDSGTVRIGSVTVPHARDYWGEITDRGTPRDEASRYSEEIRQMEDALFRKSEQAANAGAKIVFWSEGNGVFYEDDYARFMERGAEFARKHGVYFAPAFIALRYGQAKNDNKIVLFTPDGSIGFEYEKTNSWYPTESDGILDTIETPYGVIGTVICFDLDFPAFVRQAYRAGTDILLVPGFDSRLISPYHTIGGSLRGIEYGFSVVRQANKSVSIASDYNGRFLGYQSTFDTEDTVMISDVPVKGIRTFYGSIGFDWVPWLSVLLVVTLVTAAAVGKNRKGKQQG